MAVPPLSILVVNPVMPRPDRDSGSLRLYRLLKLLVGEGHRLTLIARFGLGDERCALDLEKNGIEVHRVDPERLAARGFDLNVALAPLDLDALLRTGRFDVAVLSTWEVAEQYLPIVRRVSPLTRTVIDTVDVHHVRERRGAEIAGDPALLRRAESTRAREAAIYAQADALLAVTAPDGDELRALAPEVPVHVVSNVHDRDPRGPQFAPRAGVLFVGAFTHPPNVDAAIHLVRDVWPAVRAALPDARLTLVGTAPPAEVQALAGDGVVVTGWVPAVRPYLDRARVSVAPLRFGAGVKGKIGEALGAGLPVVTTSIGAEGMGLADGETALVADGAAELAAAIVRLHEDAALWERVAAAGHEHVGATLGSPVAVAALDAMLSAVAPPTFLAPRGLDESGVGRMLAGYLGAFAETDPVSLVVPVADDAAASAMFGVLVGAIVALGRDPEHIPDLAVTPCPAGAPMPHGARVAPVGSDGWDLAPTAPDPEPRPCATLVVRPGEDAGAAEAQLAALAAAGVPDDVEILVTADVAPAPALEALIARVEGVRTIRIPDFLGRRAAIQRAAFHARGEVVVVLESLVHPQPGFLAPLVAAVRAGAARAAPVLDGAHGYRAGADGSLWPRDAAAPGDPDALALDCLAARRELWLDTPVDLPAREGHAETQLAAWARDHGGIAVARAAQVTRIGGDPASILICTRNRAAELPDCVALLVASGAEDVVILDNGSTDATPELARRLAATYPGVVRAVCEPVAGLSRARNTAAEHARHENLLYVDDDARPGPGWLERITWALSREGVVHAGGPIVGLWPDERPDGWPAPGREGLLSILDHGDADADLAGPVTAYGANWAVRRAALRAIGGFDVEVGLRPGHSVNGDEIVPFRRLEQLAGSRSRYVALGAVGHRIDPARISDRWMLRRTLTAGLESPQVFTRVHGAAPEVLQADMRKAAYGLVERCPVAGELTLEQAVAALDGAPRPLEARLDAAYALGVVAASALLLGRREAAAGALKLLLREEHLSGRLEEPAEPSPTPSLEAA
jgi:glycosyltransferase involved in cell wall biosynthesis